MSGGGVNSIQVYFGFFNFAKLLSRCVGTGLTRIFLENRPNMVCYFGVSYHVCFVCKYVIMCKASQYCAHLCTCPRGLGKNSF